MGKADDHYTPEQRAIIKKMVEDAADVAKERERLDRARKIIDRAAAISDGLIPSPWAEKLLKKLLKPASEPPSAEPPKPVSEAEPKPKRKGKKMSRVRPLVCKLYPPDGIAPDDVKTWQAVRAVKKVYPDVSRDVVERAIGRRKD